MLVTLQYVKKYITYNKKINMYAITKKKFS